MAEACGVFGCLNPSIGFTEMVSLYDVHLSSSMCMSICQVHKQLMESKRKEVKKT